MNSSNTTFISKAGSYLLLLFFFASTAQAQNKDIILRATPDNRDCPQGAIKFELPTTVKSDQKVTYKIVIKNSQGQSGEYEGTGELKAGKTKYSLEPGIRGAFNGSIAVEIVFPDNSVARSNEVAITQTQNPKSKCDWPQTGNQMAADPPPPPPRERIPRFTGYLKAEYQIATRQSGNTCPANAAISGSVRINETVRDTVYYRFVRWDARSLSSLQSYYKVDLENLPSPQKGGNTSTARVGSKISVLPSSANIIPSTWVIGEKGGLLNEGVVQLWSVIPGPNGTFTYGRAMGSVNLICGPSLGNPSKGGGSVIKPNSKPR